MSTPVKPKSDRYDCSEKPHFHRVNVNPASRHTADCVIRAMALFLQWTWTDVMKDLMAYCIENGLMPNYKSGYGAYLTCQGFPWQKVSGKCTVKEFLEKYAKPGRTYLLSTSNHITCIRDGRINDTWDCSNRPVKFYWEKEDREVRKPFYEVTIQDNEQ